MDMMGRVGLVEIPILIAPDQKVWMDRMIKEGKLRFRRVAHWKKARSIRCLSVCCSITRWRNKSGRRHWRQRTKTTNRDVRREAYLVKRGRNPW
jgi:hypothetical protein